MVAAAWIVFMISIGIVAAIAVVVSRRHPADLSDPKGEARRRDTVVDRPAGPDAEAMDVDVDVDVDVDPGIRHADDRPADPDVEGVLREESAPVPDPERVVPEDPNEIVLDDDRPRPE